MTCTLYTAFSNSSQFLFLPHLLTQYGIRFYIYIYERRYHAIDNYEKRKDLVKKHLKHLTMTLSEDSAVMSAGQQISPVEKSPEPSSVDS